MATTWRCFVVFAVLLIFSEKGQAIQNCSLKADVVFIVDSSRSIWMPDFKVELEFLDNITQGLNVGPDATHVGIINFSEGAKVELYLGQLDHDLPALRSRIRSIQHMQGGLTETYEALRVAREEVLRADRGARSDVPHIIIIITDGVSSDRGRTRREAELVRRNGIQTFVVGIGNLDVAQLKEMATSDAPGYVHTVSSFKALDSALPQILPAACQATTTAAPLPPTTTPQPPAAATEGPQGDQPPEGLCGSKKADVVFVLDKSSSITAEHFQTQLRFARDVMSVFHIARDHTHISVVTFDTQPRLEFGLLDYFSFAEVQEAVMNIEYTAGSTNTFLALQLVNDSVLTPGGGARPEVAQVVVVVTDGKSSDGARTKYWAEQLKKQGAYVFAIGVGEDADPEELVNIGSHPSGQYVFRVDGYSALDTIRDILAFRACEVPSGDTLSRCHHGGRADVMFVTEFSQAGGRDVQRTTELLKEVAGGLMTSDGGAGPVRVGLVSSECPDVGDVTLARASTAEEFAAALSLGPGAAAGRLEPVLARAREQLTVRQYGARSNVTRLAVVFLHGPVSDLKQATREVMRAKSAVNRPGVKFVWVGLGERVEEKQLLQLSSERDPRQAQVLVDGGAQGPLQWADVLAKICDVLEPEA